MILDIHTHRPAPCPGALVSIEPGELMLPGQTYSAGLHPWHLPLDPDELESRLRELEQMLADPRVLAVGEAGLDTLCSTPMWPQLQAFRAQALMAEKYEKPLIIHNVRCQEQIIALHKELHPRVRWIIHGFRGKPSVARMLLREGLSLSYGEKFNEQSVLLTPPDRLYAETDESSLPISEIISRLPVAPRPF